jgi:hypothetical protein
MSYSVVLTRQESLGMVQKRDGRRKDYEPLTPFQVWLKPRLDAKGWTYTDLHRKVLESMNSELLNKTEYSEQHIYQIVRGDPKKRESAKRPSYVLSYYIGAILGDATGAITAAGYPLPNVATPLPEFQKTNDGTPAVALDENANVQKLPQGLLDVISKDAAGTKGEE